VRIFPSGVGGSRLAGRGLWGGDFRATAPVPAGGLTARMLRSLPLGRHLSALRRRFRQWAEQYAPQDPQKITFDPRDLWLFHAADLFRVTPRTFRQVPRPAGRRGWPEAVYAKAAATYVQALASGDRRPTAAVRRAFGVAPQQARDLVKGARNRGLLTREPRQQGRATGELTEKAQAILGLDANGRAVAPATRPTDRSRRSTARRGAKGK
jgi:hypothetical protein